MQIGHYQKTHTLKYLIFETIRLLSVKHNSRPVHSFSYLHNSPGRSLYQIPRVSICLSLRKKLNLDLHCDLTKILNQVACNIIAIVGLVSFFLTTKPCLSTIHASVERKNIRQCLEIPSLIGGLVFFALFTPSRSCLHGAHGVSDNVFKRILLILFGVRIHQIAQEHSVILGLFLLAAGTYSHFFLDHTKQG